MPTKNHLFLLLTMSFLSCFVACRTAETSAKRIESINSGIIVAFPIPNQTNTIRLLSKKTNKPTQRIKEIAYHSSLLWILGADGNLFTLDLQSKQLNKIDFDGIVSDIEVNSGKDFYLLGQKKNSSSILQILKKDGDLWQEFPAIQLSKNNTTELTTRSTGITFYKEKPLVLTDKIIYSLQDTGEWKSVNLKTTNKFYHQNKLTATDDGFIYSGLNNGEWGGGLQQIEITSGKVKTIEKIEKSKICGYPLDKGCDPVTDVIRDPENSSCVIAAIGLSHMLEHGRLLRVCGSEVSVIFSKTYNLKFGDRDIEQTEAFFDLIGGNQSYFAVTQKGVYQFPIGEKEKFFQLPKLKEMAGVWLSDEIPNVVVVSTDINWAASLSGYTPLFALKN